MSKIPLPHKGRVQSFLGFIAAMIIAVSFITIPPAFASSWRPTLLVNTEAFQVIDDIDTASDIELRFGNSVNEKVYWDRTPGRFRFSDDLYVDGDLTASGTLSIEGKTTFGDAVQARSTFTTSGSIATDADLQLNADDGAANAVLTFGSDTLDETLTFLNAADRFEFSDDLRVTGGLYASGSLIVEDGQTFTIEGVTYTFPQSDGSASGKVLKTSGAGVLVWSADNDSANFAADSSYFVNDTGDTMTGKLLIDLTSGTDGLEVIENISGGTLNGGGGNLIVTNSGSINMNGTLTSSVTGSFGWSVVVQANQACNTTCTSACVAGFMDDVTGDNIVSCSNTSADNCLCAGGN